ncbi:MAG: hypothetical protein JWM09_1505 [Francisellaceae bacterium]|nr:hypothetical protein [Francisellaceae bacterium]
MDPRELFVLENTPLKNKMNNRIFTKKNLFITICISIMLILFEINNNAKQIMILSVSTDGRYVISTDNQLQAILWDTKKFKKKIISKKANLYSAYFIKNSNNILWQDTDNKVYIQNVKGDIIRSFDNYPVFGHIITTDLQHYYSSNYGWFLYKGYGTEKKMVLNMCETSGFGGAGKLLNLSMDDNEQYLLTVGLGDRRSELVPLEKGQCAREAHFESMLNETLMDTMILWNVKTGEPIRKFAATNPGHFAKMYGTLSPNGKKAISGCEQPFGYVWDTETGSYLTLDSLLSGRYIEHEVIDIVEEDEDEWWDKSNLIDKPQDLFPNNSREIAPILTLKYIDNKGHYLYFIKNAQYGLIYHESKPYPIKYFSLKKSPIPIRGWFDRNQAIDTAPHANILVMAKDKGIGIIVYKFDPAKLELKRVWVGDSLWWIDWLIHEIKTLF